MNQTPPTTGTTVPAGNAGITAADHAAAIDALAEAGMVGLKDTLRDLRTVLLAAHPPALRRSVGFWGQLLGQDIRLAAEAETLRDRIGVLLRQADAEVMRLRHQHEHLQAHAHRLRDACDLLRRDMDTLARDAITQEDGHADPAARRLAHLTSLHAAYEITARQLEIVACNALAVADRHADMLPRLAVLLDQQRGVRAGATHAMQLSSARQAIEALEQYIEHLPSSAAPATQIPEPS